MADKEQIMNNFAKDINVPSKEQIIIHGVEVLKEKINMCFILLLNKLETPETIEQTIYEHLDAFVKEWNTQLARKTQECEQKDKELLSNEKIINKLMKEVDELRQECEELTELLKLRTNDRVNKLERAIIRRNIKIDRYRKALEEIEEYIKEEEWSLLEYIIRDINNIINKAKKGEE